MPDGFIRPTNDYVGNAHSLATYTDGEHAPFTSRVSRVHNGHTAGWPRKMSTIKRAPS